MLPRRLTRTAIAAVAPILIGATGGVASAAGGDTTPPTAPYIIYAQGYQCLQLIVGVQRSTDNATPQSELTYTVFADGVSIGSLADRGQDGGVWGMLSLTKVGPNTITVAAVDAAGNRSALSNADVVTGYPC
jgi:hypothetical protein